MRLLPRSKRDARGSTRWSLPTAPTEALGMIAAEIRLDGWRRRAAQWEIAHDPRRVSSLFSLNELLVLGAQDTAGLSGWGMAGTPLSGCLCTRVAATNEWRLVGGRPQIGAVGMAMPDVNLHVAVMLSTLKLPAPLAKMVVGAAMQDTSVGSGRTTPTIG